MSDRTTRRPPRAGIDPITDPLAAWAVVSRARTFPPRHESILLPLDHVRRGHTVFVVNGTREPDDVVDVVDRTVQCVDVDEVSVAALVVASVRPGGRLDERDADRWLEMSDRCARAGIVLVEWFVTVGSSVACPRDLLGDAPRWTP